MTRMAVLALAAALASPALLAKEPQTGFYVGAGLGQSLWSADYAAQVDAAYAGSGFTVDAANITDDKDTAWKAYAGWRFNAYGAVEVGWLDFGRARSHYELGVPGVGTAVRDGRYRLAGVEVSALAIAPVSDRATLFAKAGALFSELEYDESGVNQFGEAGSFSRTNRRTLFLWGLGGTYEIVDSLSLRLEWQRAQDAGERFALNESGNGRFEHVDYVGIALQWRFR